MITQERLKELFSYDPETGVFTRLTNRGTQWKAGQVAGSISHGYVAISIDGIRYRAHRLAWLYMYGELPIEDLDHINRIRKDNRVSNLRLASRKENMQNQSIKINNKSGHTGVSWWSRDKKWRAGITINYKNINLGYFANIEDAVAAYANAKEKLHTFNPVQTTSNQAALQ